MTIDTAERIATTECLLRAERHDGNDPIEAVAHLPAIPRKGDTLAIWNAEGGWLNPTKDGPRKSGEEVWVEVTDVVFCTWAPERIEVWVRMEGYDIADLERALAAAHGNEQP